MRLTIAVLAAAVAVTFAGEAVQGWLVASADGVRAGQLWRLASGPLVHTNLGHLLRDGLFFGVLGVYAERRLGRRYPWLLLAALAVPSAAALAIDGLDVYYGLSGAFYALLVVPIVERRLVLLGVAVGAKVIWESATGELLFPLDLGDGVRAVPTAHLAGLLVGVYALRAITNVVAPSRQGTTSTDR